MQQRGRSDSRIGCPAYPRGRRDTEFARLGEPQIVGRLRKGPWVALIGSGKDRVNERGCFASVEDEARPEQFADVDIVELFRWHAVVLSKIAPGASAHKAVAQ